MKLTSPFKTSRPPVMATTVCRWSVTAENVANISVLTQIVMSVWTWRNCFDVWKEYFAIIKRLGLYWTTVNPCGSFKVRWYTCRASANSSLMPETFHTTSTGGHWYNIRDLSLVYPTLPLEEISLKIRGENVWLWPFDPDKEEQTFCSFMTLVVFYICCKKYIYRLNLKPNLPS